MARRSLPVALGIAVAIFGVAAAAAHAFIDRAEPGPGAIVGVVPSQVKVWFTGSVEPAYSWVRVVNDQGQRVDAEDSTVDDANRSLITVSLKPSLPPGPYTVRWRVLAVDGHVTEDEFTFRVKP